MLGKIVQLLGIALSDEFEVVYGINTPNTMYFTDFSTLWFMDVEGVKLKKYIKRYEVEEKPGGYKDLYVYDEKSFDGVDEDYLLVCIPHTLQLITNAKIVSRKETVGAIIEMKEGDSVEVSKESIGKRIVFKAKKVQNELILIKEEQ